MMNGYDKMVQTVASKQSFQFFQPDIRQFLLAVADGVKVMLSFVDHGHTMTLYSFARHELPDTIEQKPADEIVDASFLRRFRTDGRPNIAHFADLFRLLLFKKTDCVWVDGECLASTSTIWSGDVIVQEAGGSIINCRATYFRSRPA
jgi:hypothetical protein